MITDSRKHKPVERLGLYLMVMMIWFSVVCSEPETSNVIINKIEKLEAKIDSLLVITK